MPSFWDSLSISFGNLDFTLTVRQPLIFFRASGSELFIVFCSLPSDYDTKMRPSPRPDKDKNPVLLTKKSQISSKKHNQLVIKAYKTEL
jgi:hypothetical protein